MLQRLIILFFCFSLNATLHSQNPAYILLGKDELSGVDIYSICQSKDKSIWLTSNRGVIKFNGYTYKFLPNNHLKAQSSFNILQNSKGELFCFNLFGQILKIEEDTVKVFVELPDSLVFTRYEMEVDESDNLLLKSKKNILIDSKGNFKIIPNPIPNKTYNSETKRIEPCFTLRETDKSNIYHTPNLFTLYKWDGEKFNEFIINHNHVPQSMVTHLTFRTKENMFLFTMRNGGMYAFHKDGSPAYSGHHLFKNYMISGFLEDYEGNLWLTTIGKGILLIKNEKVISYRDHYLIKNKSISVSKFHKYGNIYLGTENGQILRIDQNGTIEELFANGSVNIQFIQFYKKYILSNGGFSIEMIDTSKLTSRQVGDFPAVKKSHKLNENEYLFATNQGVYHCEMTQDFIFRKKERFKIGRCNTALPINTVNDFYAGSTKGLFRVYKKVPKELFYDNKKIIASSICESNDKVFTGTTTNGILVIKGDHVQHRIGKEEGLLSDRILSLKASGSLIFIASDEGLQVYDSKSDQFILPHIKNIINGSRIISFDVRGKELIIITNKDIQRFSISDVRKNNTPPTVQLRNIWIDGKSIDYKKYSEFEYYENKFEFEFIGKSYGHSGKLKYKYRLFPLDQEWEYSEFLNNKAKFGLLGPGEYTFQVIAINENDIESEIQEYRFVIHKAFWQTWWFYLIVTISLTGAVVGLWRIQIRRIRKKNQQEKELIGSKLTALKLQMNPHFIFNALNSIQDLILKEDTENSYDYIVKFSNLVRRILNYSDKEFIEIEEEIEILRLYLELENLRFKKDFNFEIINTISDEIRIPSMIIQPFVENSVKHGLLHKSGSKNLTILFEINNIVTCSIIDDGIGIERSKQINARRQHQHESVSIKSIRNRIEFLKQYYKSDLGIEFVNLYDANELPSGTKVILRLPYEKIY